MSCCLAQGNLLSYMTARMSQDIQGTQMHTVKSLYCPPKTQNIVNKLYSYTK